MNRQGWVVTRVVMAIFALSSIYIGAIQAQETPRTADGRPDLSGFWHPGAMGFRGFENEDGDIILNLEGRDSDLGNFEKDFAVLERSKANKPLYKPEHWDRIQDLDWNGLTLDPLFGCKPAAIPRVGPPHKIVQTPNEIIFLYDTRNINAYRIIPMDGREHLDIQVNDTTWMGYSVGRWEGDTLVVDSVGFNDESWLGWMGYIHSWDMTVTERIRREGNTLYWEATVDDTMLIEPWAVDPIQRELNEDPDAFFFGNTGCEERDADRIVDPTVRG